MFMPKRVFDGYMSLLTLTLTFWLLFSLLVGPDPVLPHLPPVSFSLFPHQMPEQESSTGDWVISNLCASLSLCVSLYLPSYLNWTKLVARAKPGACQRITLPVCVPTSGLWFSAWLWLWSWPSMHYRSTRRGKKEVIHPQADPKSRRCYLWDWY